MQHKQDAVEGSFITDGSVATTAFTGCNERRNEGLQLLSQLFADGGTGHETAKHKCICSLQIEVALATLKDKTIPVLPLNLISFHIFLSLHILLSNDLNSCTRTWLVIEFLSTFTEFMDDFCAPKSPHNPPQITGDNDDG